MTAVAVLSAYGILRAALVVELAQAAGLGWRAPRWCWRKSPRAGATSGVTMACRPATPT